MDNIFFWVPQNDFFKKERYANECIETESVITVDTCGQTESVIAVDTCGQTEWLARQ
jgi:hypothetical protein